MQGLFYTNIIKHVEDYFVYGKLEKIQFEIILWLILICIVFVKKALILSSVLYVCARG